MRNEKKAQYLHSHFLVVNILAEEFHCVHSAVVNTAHCLTKKLETHVVTTFETHSKLEKFVQQSVVIDTVYLRA